MLIEFSVGNYRSFKERVTLSMEAAEIASQPPSLDEHNVFAANDDLRLLTSAAIYGANASGKSNLIMALRFMRSFVLSSSRETQSGELIVVEPFRLNISTEHQPSTFELVLLIAGEQYRYGFAITRERVLEEWLYRLGTSREVTLFTRDVTGIKVSSRSFREGRGLEERTRSNALFLSVVAQFNGPIASQLLEWLRHMEVNTGIDDDFDVQQAIHRFEDEQYGEAITNLIRQLDIGIEHLAFERGPAVPSPFMNRAMADQFHMFVDAFAQRGMTPERNAIKTQHQRFDALGQPVDSITFDLEYQESAGTRRLFALAYPLIQVLQEGLVFVVDELDARIHPNLIIELIKLFNNPTTNPKHAQLIFTTHNTNLLNAKLFRRDQVWFVEKSRQGASDLYSLVEYRADGKIIRNDASFEKDYVAGRYGAVPFIGDLSALLGAEHEQTLQH